MTLEIPLYQVDAFASKVFTGNPAAVCPLESWLPDETLQAIAAENNLAETAYFIDQGDHYHLRWFTPTTEVKLCGHATLASAYVITSYLDPGRDKVSFQSMSGALEVTRDGDLLTLDFPTLMPAPHEDDGSVAEALGLTPSLLWCGDDYVALLESQAQVRDARPDLAKVAGLEGRGLIITAEGDEVDFVSRFFAPSHGIPEDPVTGSAHSLLTPIWAERLGKTRMVARQISARGGELQVELRGERVMIGGHAVPYLKGTITL